MRRRPTATLNGWVARGVSLPSMRGADHCLAVWPRAADLRRVPTAGLGHGRHPLRKGPQNAAVRVSDATVSRTLRRHGLQRLPNRVGRRAVHTHCYEQHVPGHRVQMDVTCLTLLGPGDRRIRLYPSTAIADAARGQALRVYRRHTPQLASAFVDDVVGTFPFRMRTIRPDRGPEFQALFHWHVADHGIRHVYSKPRTPQLNGTVERSHRTDQQEFYQLLSDKGDTDLKQRLTEWGVLQRSPPTWRLRREDAERSATRTVTVRATTVL